MAARLLFGVLAQLAGEIVELVQGWAFRHSCSTIPAMARLWEPSTRMLASSRNKDMPGPPMIRSFT